MFPVWINNYWKKKSFWIIDQYIFGASQKSVIKCRRMELQPADCLNTSKSCMKFCGNGISKETTVKLTNVSFVFILRENLREKKKIENPMYFRAQRIHELMLWPTKIFFSLKCTHYTFRGKQWKAVISWKKHGFVSTSLETNFKME